MYRSFTNATPGPGSYRVYSEFGKIDTSNTNNNHHNQPANYYSSFHSPKGSIIERNNESSIVSSNRGNSGAGKMRARSAF